MLALYSAETGIYRLLFDESADTAELTPVEQDRLTAYIGALLRTTEEAYLLNRDGLLDDEYWMTRARVMMAALRTDEARQIYVQTRALGFYTSDYRDSYDKKYCTGHDPAVRRDRIDKKRQQLHQRMKRRSKSSKRSKIW